MKIHRFKCSPELNQEIMNFSEIHKFDIDETLLEQFEGWLEQHKDLVTREAEFLRRHEYEDPIETKIFKSIKYYYIKKFTKEPEKKKVKKKAQKIDPQMMQLKKNDDPLIKKSYKNQYYQMKNKLYNINERQFP